MKARKVEGLDPEAPLRPNAARIVATRLAELRSLAEPALDPAAAGAQHDLRIAAKRLRYVLEMTGACFGPEAEAARKAAKELQDVLGEIHDCDVMLRDARRDRFPGDAAAHPPRAALRVASASSGAASPSAAPGRRSSCAPSLAPVTAKFTARLPLSFTSFPCSTRRICG